VSDIRGRPPGGVEEVELTNLDSGRTRTLACDLVVFTADWVPDHELAVMAGCEPNPGTRGPRVDAGLRTSAPGVFAAGNLVHPAETADVCALDGRHLARSVAEHLRPESGRPSEAPLHTGDEDRRPRLPIEVEAPLRWVCPNLLAPTGGPPRARFLLRSDAFMRAPRVEVRQGEATLWRGRLPRLIPGRSAKIPASWASRVDADGGAVSVRVL
jgi:hypothetical protein